MRENNTYKLRLGWANGIIIELGKTMIFLDPQSSNFLGNHAFISHAHGDHTAGFNSEAKKYSTAETLRLYEKGHNREVTKTQLTRHNETIEVNDVEVTAYNAGHMLGSTQFEFRTPNETIVYTGDINCVDTLTTNAAKSIECDVLIVEATYGNPAFVFPSREIIYTEIAKWTVDQVRERKIPVFQVYPAGKAQEIIKLLNLFTEIPVVTHKLVTKISKVCQEFGLTLEFVDADTKEGEEKLASGCCAYVTPTFATPKLSRKISRAITTGWAIRFRPRTVSAAFPLSSHSDFKQLVNYVKESKPSMVYTCFGYEEALAEYLRKRCGVKSRPIPQFGQKPLQEFL
jgi:putative mRNA 3-end processing factor